MNTTDFRLGDSVVIIGRTGQSGTDKYIGFEGTVYGFDTFREKETILVRLNPSIDSYTAHYEYWFYPENLDNKTPYFNRLVDEYYNL